MSIRGSIPRQIIDLTVEHQQNVTNRFEAWGSLPIELRRLILGYGTWSNDARYDGLWHPTGHKRRRPSFLFFAGLSGKSVDKSHPRAYFFTGFIRVLVRYPDPYTPERIVGIHPNDTNYKKWYTPGTRFFRSMRDTEQYRLWGAYGDIIDRASPNPLVQKYSSAGWSQSSQWEKSNRLYKHSEHEVQFAAEENQESCVVFQREGETATMHNCLFASRIYPSQYSIYRRNKEKENRRPFVLSEPQQPPTTTLLDMGGGETFTTSREGFNYRRKTYWDPQDVIPNRHLKTSNGFLIYRPVMWRFTIAADVGQHPTRNVDTHGGITITETLVEISEHLFRV